MSGAFQADVQRCFDSSRGDRRLWRLFAENYGLQALLAYRLGRWLLRHNRLPWWPLLPTGWIVYYLLSRYVRLAFDIRLELSADIGPGLYIGHFGGLRARKCRIGASCSVGRLTEIGPIAGAGPGPVIGDRVWMGASVHILGPYRIGSDATVSAGAVVSGDVPERALCLGNPARIVMRNYDNRAILGFRDQTPTVALKR